ncbi:D-Ala-D-Ala carboxypeptidase family metallohydrolase [Candidatus Vondammii sp. HM_W22]|uniref:D-Ala-D-Ala carboxypeptidase family metallohydrolase n=1 Tax=Candidatus Vondammii sp. HM_W22 TaxID=2687299 RepID=UPI001F138E3E|nr:D-Ala-D-Ala carboxypeptidase family metallohydrolase [Candidatus Vondammii sp. HM_W22]
MSRIQLSDSFYLDEFTRSQTAARRGIDMSVYQGSAVYFYLRCLCWRVLQPLRNALGPVHITSGYRPPKLNRLIGGSPASQHQYGQAVDVVVTGHAPLEVATWLCDHVTGYDQLIHEFGEWVHVSVPSTALSTPAMPGRMERLTAIKVSRLIGKPRTVYVTGLRTLEEARQLHFTPLSKKEAV